MDLNSPVKMMLPQAPLLLDSEEVYTESSTSDAGLSEDLEIALARVLDPDSREYNKGLERIKSTQRRWAVPVEEVAREEGYCLKLQMEVTLGKTGNVYFAQGSYIG